MEKSSQPFFVLYNIKCQVLHNVIPTPIENKFQKLF